MDKESLPQSRKKMDADYAIAGYAFFLNDDDGSDDPSLDSIPKSLDEILYRDRVFPASNTVLFREFEEIMRGCDPQQIKQWNYFVDRMANCILKSALNPCILREKDHFRPPTIIEVEEGPDKEIQKIDINEAINNAESIQEIEHFLEIAEQNKVPIREDYKDILFFIKALKELNQRLMRSSKKLLNPIVELLYFFSVVVADRCSIDYYFLQKEKIRKASNRRTILKITKYESFIPYFNLVREKMKSRSCGLMPASFDVYNSCKKEKKFQELFLSFYKVDIKENEKETQEKAKKSFYYLVRAVHNYRKASFGIGLSGSKPKERKKRSAESKNRTSTSMLGSYKRRKKRVKRKKKQ